MKKVLIIGNGFDRAHGAPTSFIDFSIYSIKDLLIPDLKAHIISGEKSKYFGDTIQKKSDNSVFPYRDNSSIQHSLRGALKKIIKEAMKY
ncbi:hypothetical protein ES692_02765 [Psychroserpens burtonensis]|uniref:Uncharacterized protein n=1 Tax=Psychroserpens burtonensis TaxID=49278 RepID=A0A5C7BIM2_9FLAO|nr:AbiH family protein [Psychroserpens burtonensis]TXE19689.1 hypothetical protein ES692_02765 [Psychroserpens burtonensis]